MPNSAGYFTRDMIEDALDQAMEDAADASSSSPMADYVAYGASFEDGQLVTLVGIAALLGLGKGGVPGLATVATALTVATAPRQIPGGLAFAVALQNPVLTMIDVAAAYLHWHEVDLHSIAPLVPFSFVGLGVGQVLGNHLTDSQARLLVGVFLLVVLGLQVLPKKDQSGGSATTKVSSFSDHDPLLAAESGSAAPSASLRRRTRSEDSESGGGGTPAPNKTVTPSASASASTNNSSDAMPDSTRLAWVATVGVVGGAATMLTNAMGPILNVYLLGVCRLAPESYIGTRAFFFCVLNVGKLPMRFMGGTLGMSMMPLAGLLGAVSVVGVVGAKPILAGFPRALFNALELAVVAFSGLRLCWMGYSASGS